MQLKEIIGLDIHGEMMDAQIVVEMVCLTKILSLSDNYIIEQVSLSYVSPG